MLPASIPLVGRELVIQVVVERALPAVPGLASAVGMPTCGAAGHQRGQQASRITGILTAASSTKCRMTRN